MAKGWLAHLQRGYGRKLHALHGWNGWITALLAVTGLLLAAGFWRGVLGEGRVWIKWAHIGIGLLSLLPVLYYLALAAKHWKQLRGKPWQRFNVLTVLALLLGWFVSGVLLWQFRAAGPRVSNAALLAHDLLSWIGLPYIVYHSLTRVRWLQEPNRRTIRSERAERDRTEELHPAAPQPVLSRQTFIRGAIGTVLAVLLGPSFLKWLGTTLGGGFGGMGGGVTPGQLAASDANRLTPLPEPLPASAPPAGGGARGSFRIYTVAPIPTFTNANWSFAIDGLVDNPVRYDWATFVRLRRTAQVSDFHCVTGWSVYGNTWEGIPLRELLDTAGVRGEAVNVKFYSGDGVYTDTLTLEQARMEDVMAAMLHDGKLIPGELGGPVRLIVPKMYAYKSVKWLTRIELIGKEHTGYWEERGYDKDAWV